MFMIVRTFMSRKFISVACGTGNYLSNTGCAQCPQDTYSDRDDATQCAPCPSDTQSYAGSASYADCTRGK